MQTRSAAPMKYVTEFSAPQDVSRGKSASQNSWQLDEEEETLSAMVYEAYVLKERYFPGETDCCSRITPAPKIWFRCLTIVRGKECE
jgi:hypothetical protein